MVPEKYIETSVVKVPRVEHFTETIMEPEEYTEVFTERVPKVVLIDKEVPV